MSTALVAVDGHVAKAKEYRQAGEDYFVRAGRELQLAKDGCKTNLEFNAALCRAGIPYSTAHRWLQFSKEPEKAEEHRKNQRARDNARNSHDRESKPAKENRELPSQGEIHEAKQGFKAMIRKAAIAGDQGDWRTSHAKRTVAFAHFKKLLSASNLPALMGMTADEIIELIRTI